MPQSQSSGVARITFTSVAKELASFNLLPQLLKAGTMVEVRVHTDMATADGLVEQVAAPLISAQTPSHSRAVLPSRAGRGDPMVIATIPALEARELDSVP